MKVRDWAILIAASAALPWLAIQLTSFAGINLPIFIWHLDESNSRSLIVFSSQIQRQFENLAFAVPTGAFLAWAIRGSPVNTALLVMAGYSLTWLGWCLLEGDSLSEAFLSLFFYYQIPVVLWLGLCVFAFGVLYQRKKKVNA